MVLWVLCHRLKQSWFLIFVILKRSKSYPAKSSIFPSRPCLVRLGHGLGVGHKQQYKLMCGCALIIDIQVLFQLSQSIFLRYLKAGLH